ncbi:hypothetical protein CsSME_00003424 [Camellia sinensis var. sinensis]
MYACMYVNSILIADYVMLLWLFVNWGGGGYGRDVMSHSFGEGYASRSDEEGFGGTTCEASDAASKIEQDRMIHENHPAYDKSQGSEVAEKEKARHQTTADS